MVQLTDSHNRKMDYLRISVTDRCNFRCQYCMPEDIQFQDKSHILSYEEMLVFAEACLQLGVTKVRVTGGEPLVRRGVVWFVGQLKELGFEEVTMTTNGFLLEENLEGLVEAGLDRINISLDTLQPETFTGLSRRRRLPDVLAGVRAAKAAGLEPVKINTVLMRGVNDHEAVPLLEWAMAEGVQLRFIEQMPLDAQHAWQRSTMVTAAEIRERLSGHVSLVEDPADVLARGSAPAELFRVAGTEHKVGIIAAVSKPFCGSCDRVRLTADGQIRTCLFSGTESDLRAPLRSGADDAELADRWLVAMAGKQPGHGIDDPSFLQPDRPMSAIGG
jgi:cyclic pyranopterin phosphate synthase